MFVLCLNALLVSFVFSPHFTCTAQPSLQERAEPPVVASSALLIMQNQTHAHFRDVGHAIMAGQGHGMSFLCVLTVCVLFQIVKYCCMYFEYLCCIPAGAGGCCI
jgi:hypothetical protein